jgi:hypothetical protein
MNAWTGTGTRELRPFFGAQSLEKALDEAAVRLSKGAEPQTEESIDVALSEVEGAGIELLPSLNAQHIADVLADRAGDFALILTIRDPMFRRRVRTQRWSLAGDIPSSIEIPAAIIRKFGHGQRIEAALTICLSADRAPEAGWPSIVGSWIARKKFSFGIRTQNSGFDIQPLTAKIRAANKLPEGALVFADILGDIAAPMEEGESFASCYVAPKVFEAMQADRNGETLNAIMQAEIIAAIISRIGEDLRDRDSEDHDPRSPLAKVLKKIGGKEPMSVAAFRSLLNNPGRLRAVIHDIVGINAYLEKL